MNIKQKYYRWKAIRKTIQRYRYLIELDKVMEEFDTWKILQGGSEKYISDGRKNLLEVQMRLAEEEKFLGFLKSL